MKKSDFPKCFFDVISHDDVVSIVTWCKEESEPHIANTWTSYLEVTDDGRILLPAIEMEKTQENIQRNSKIMLTVGSKKVTGFRGVPGAGFLVIGNAEILSSGQDYDFLKKKIPYLTNVIAVSIISMTQTL